MQAGYYEIVIGNPPSEETHNVLIYSKNGGYIVKFITTGYEDRLSCLAGQLRSAELIRGIE